MRRSPELDPVADPTQLRLIRALSERDNASLGELAAAAEVHPNTARPRLRRLQAARIVERVTERRAGRGRPSIRYRLARGWRLPTTDFLGLAELLAAAVLRVGFADRDVDSLGREWGRRLLAGSAGEDAVSLLPAILRRLGFDARMDGRRVVLGACPCPLVMPERPELLCRLASATMSGLLEAAGSELRPAEADHDPARRSCSVCLAPSG